MRARNLKPAFFMNERLARLGPYAQLLFAGLWGLADREGRLENRPDWIKANVFPHYDLPLPEGSQVLPHAGLLLLLSSLARSGFVRFYGGKGGRKYILIVAFKRHQTPHHREAQSIIPPPSLGKARGSAPEQPRAQHQPRQGLSRADSGLLTPDSLSLDSGLPLPQGAAPRGRGREREPELRRVPELASRDELERRRQQQKAALNQALSQ